MTIEEYKELLKEQIPTIVKFHADWCSPCKVMSKTVEKVIEEWEDRIQIITVDVDSNPEIASLENIRNIPALLYYKNGQLRDKNIGVVTKEIIDNKLLLLI